MPAVLPRRQPLINIVDRARHLRFLLVRVFRWDHREKLQEALDPLIVIMLEQRRGTVNMEFLRTFREECSAAEWTCGEGGGGGGGALLGGGGEELEAPPGPA